MLLCITLQVEKLSLFDVIFVIQNFFFEMNKILHVLLPIVTILFAGTVQVQGNGESAMLFGTQQARNRMMQQQTPQNGMIQNITKKDPDQVAKPDQGRKNLCHQTEPFNSLCLP